MIYAKDYLESEVGLNIHHQKIIQEQNKKILIAHDGLGEGDYLYKLIKTILNLKFVNGYLHNYTQILHSDAHKWSKKSRKKASKPFISKDKEILFKYCKNFQEKNPIDYYVMGHRHLPLEINIDKQAKYINLGEWINYNSYAILENVIIKLNKY